jgi:hypothetical protein
MMQVTPPDTSTVIYHDVRLPINLLIIMIQGTPPDKPTENLRMQGTPPDRSTDDHAAG